MNTPPAARSAIATSRRRREAASAITSGPANASVTAIPIGIRSIASKNDTFSTASDAP